MFPIGFLYRGLALNPDGIAAEDDARALSYRALVAEVEAMAAALQDRGVGAGERVGICAENNLQHLVAMLAVYAAGATWVPLNPRNAKAELDAIVALTRPALVIVDESCLDRIDLAGTPRLLARTAAASDADDTMAGAIERHAGRRPAWPKRTLADIQGVKFTGGSSGRPKGVLQSYRCINTLVASFLLTYGFTRDDCNLCAAPLTHGTSCMVLPILAVGGRHILRERIKPPEILESFVDRGVSTVFLPPTVIYAMLGHPGVEAMRFPQLRHLIWGAAPMPAERIREARRVFRGGFEACYGQTEAPMLLAAMRADDFMDDANLASCGRTTALTEIGIMDGDGRLLPPGETGEIVARGDLLMSGYLDMPDVTAATLVDGWLHTGDVGSLDDRGFLFLKDRLRDVVISGGFNVYPSDVEARLAQHPAVHECIVFGVPDPKWGERVEAAVQLRDGAAATPEALIAFAREALGPVKTPKMIHFARDLPKSPVGKVLRREAKARYGAVLEYSHAKQTQ